MAIKQSVTLDPRYNIAPSQQIPIIRHTDKNKLSMVRWGLIPHCSKDKKIGYKLINARAETITEKPSFRDAFKSRRCPIGVAVRNGQVSAIPVPGAVWLLGSGLTGLSPLVGKRGKGSILFLHHSRYAKAGSFIDFAFFCFPSLTKV